MQNFGNIKGNVKRLTTHDIFLSKICSCVSKVHLKLQCLSKFTNSCPASIYFLTQTFLSTVAGRLMFACYRVPAEAALGVLLGRQQTDVERSGSTGLDQSTSGTYFYW